MVDTKQARELAVEVSVDTKRAREIGRELSLLAYSEAGQLLRTLADDVDRLKRVISAVERSLPEDGLFAEAKKLLRDSLEQARS